jgi:hypothetical protein
MDAESLKALQAPLKVQYREAPDAAVITLHAESNGIDGVACKLSTSKGVIEAGLHPATGGSGMQACSGDMLLEALVAWRQHTALLRRMRVVGMKIMRRWLLVR